MNVKQAIRELQKLERQRMAAIQSGQDAEEARANEVIGRLQEVLEAWVDMAEAAIAVLEHILDHEHDDQLDGRTYIREQGGLWDAIVAARKKAKAINQQ